MHGAYECHNKIGHRQLGVGNQQILDHGSMDHDLMDHA